MAIDHLPITAAPTELQAGDPRLAERVAAAMRAPGAAIVCGVDVGDDAALLDVVALAGSPSSVGNGGGLIYDVTPQPPSEQIDLSSTSKRFPLHTDSTYLAAPHDVIALGCLDAPRGGGGESHLMHVDVVIAHVLRAAGEDTLAALCEVAYPFAVDIDGERVVAPLPILRRDGPTPTIRYRDDVIATVSEAASIRSTSATAPRSTPWRRCSGRRSCTPSTRSSPETSCSPTTGACSTGARRSLRGLAA